MRNMPDKLNKFWSNLYLQVVFQIVTYFGIPAFKNNYVNLKFNCYLHNTFMDWRKLISKLPRLRILFVNFNFQIILSLYNK